MKKEVIYTCPRCGGALKFYKDINGKTFLIINRNGTFDMPIINKENTPHIIPIELICSNCDFIYYRSGDNEKNYPHLDNLCENIRSIMRRNNNLIKKYSK